MRLSLLLVMVVSTDMILSVLDFVRSRSYSILG